MKIQGPYTAGVLSAERAKKKRGASAFSVGEDAAEETGEVEQAVFVNQMAALNSLLSLQEVDTLEVNAQRNEARGRQLLHALEKLHLDVLLGQLDGAHLHSLHQIFQQTPSSSGDARLDEIIMEIEQRVAIEWAKWERNAARG